MKHLVRIGITVAIFLMGLVLAPYIPAAPAAFRWQRYAGIYQPEHIYYLPLVMQSDPTTTR